VPTKFIKHICDGLYELRLEYNSNIYRVFFIFDEGQIVVLFNGFQKKTQKTPQTEIEKALKIIINMQKTIITIGIIFFSFASFAQTISREELEQALKPLNDKVEALEVKNTGLNLEIKRLHATLLVASAKIMIIIQNLHSSP
jgi:heme/copper-type cytochrome/quinol oxidase subunit 2